MKLFLAILALTSMAMADDANEKLLIAGNNQFTAKMFSEVVKSHPEESVVLSAFSVLTPLALLSQAAEGASHDELLRAIGMPNDETARQVYSEIYTKLRGIKGVDLKQANRIYIPERYQLNDNFTSVARQFQSEVLNVDFAKNDETAKAVNAWVEAQTNNRIKDLVDPSTLGPTTRALLVNAIYFKGTWEKKFEPANTVDRDFHVTKDKTIKVPTMSRTAEFLYGESEELDAKLLRLPYTGGESSMLIVLPNQIDGLAALEAKLKDPEALTKATGQMMVYEVDVKLPKFKIETKTNLKEVLMKIDVKQIFDSANAKLSHLLKGESDLFVSDAIQKAFIEVNEEGAEAAAANVIQILKGSSPDHLRMRPRPKIFTANKPFYFEIEILKRRIFSGSNTFNKNKK